MNVLIVMENTYTKWKIYLLGLGGSVVKNATVNMLVYRITVKDIMG